MVDYSTHFNTRATGVNQPIPGREPEMVKNSTGSFTFQLEDQARLKRFLILGAESGTYYASEKKLTVENANFIKTLASGGAEWLVPAIVEVSDKGLAPKNDAAIFALAMSATFGTESVKKAAYKAIPAVCRIGTHLFHFTQAIQNMRGWSRGLRRGVARYYEGKTVDNFAYDLMKYRQRDGWEPLDVIRLSHPRLTEEHRGMIEDLKEKEHKFATPARWQAYKELATLDVKSWKRAVKLIQDHKLPWEAVPTELHGRAEVWEALVQDMGLGALLRNLSRLAKLGLTHESGLDETTRLIASKFANKDLIKKSRLHPITILNGGLAYGEGRSPRGGDGWKTSARVKSALDQAFYLGFDNVVPTGKRGMLALDVSSSMCNPKIAGTSLTPRQVTGAMACVTLAVEEEVFITGFTNNIQALDIRKGQPLENVIRYIDGLGFSNTNISLPFTYAQKNNLKLDYFSVYTDCEVNAGTHPAQALKEYRRKVGVEDAKLIVVAMTATNFTIADPKDRNMIDVAGFSTDTPSILSAFVRGDI